VIDEPEEQAQGDAEDEARNDRKVDPGVFAAMDDVAGKAAEAKRKFAAEVKESADGEDYRAEKEKSAA
jgi:hypothetical protein